MRFVRFFRFVFNMLEGRGLRRRKSRIEIVRLHPVVTFEGIACIVVLIRISLHRLLISVITGESLGTSVIFAGVFSYRRIVICVFVVTRVVVSVLIRSLVCVVTLLLFFVITVTAAIVVARAEPVIHRSFDRFGSEFPFFQHSIHPNN